MTVCHGCGGVIGRDCWNPQECEAITRDMAARYEEQGCGYAQADLDALKARVKELEAALRKLSTAQCLGNGEVLGMSLSDHPLGREILARMEIARAALEGEKT